MAVEADQVVVELVAKVDGFNAQMKGASAAFSQDVKQIESSAVGAETANRKLSASLGGSQIAMASFGQTTRTAGSEAALGFTAVTNAAHGNSIAMRETLVVARELSMGNFTRLPGSLSILAQQFAISGKSAMSFAGQILQAFGIVKKTVDAQAGAEAVAAAQGAASIRVAAEKAAANIAAADTEAALARAQISTATTAEALAAAQTRLAQAHVAVSAAADEAAIAEVALAEAEGRAAEASAASAATMKTTLGPIGIILAGVAITAGLVVGAFKAMQSQLRSDHTLDDYANSLGLTKKEMTELRKEVGDLSGKEMKDLDARAAAFALTWGDVFNGIKKASADALDISPEWQAFKDGMADAFKSGLAYAETFAAGAYGVVVGSYRTIVDTWKHLPESFSASFTAAVNVAIDALNGLVKQGVNLLNGFIHEANKLPFVHIADAAVAPIQHIAADAGKKAGKSFSENVADATAEAHKAIAKNVSVIWDDIIGAAENRIKKAADRIIEDRSPKKAPKPKKQSDHGLADSLDTIDAQIEGQWKLAAAYQISDAAVIKAEALQKAEEQAIRHKGDVGIYYEKELALAVATRAADGAKVIADLHDQAAAHKQINDMVAAGLLPASQMSEALDLESKKRQLLAALAIAEANNWIDRTKELRKEIDNLIGSEHALTVELSREQYLRTVATNDQDIEKLKLEASLIGSSNKERATAIAQLEAIQQLRSMPGLTPAEQSDFIQSYVDKAQAALRTPFQQWADTIPQTAEAVNDALQSIELKGLDGIASAITDVISGTKSFGQAFGDIAKQIMADIIQMTIKMMLFKAISGIFGGGGGLGKSLYPVANGVDPLAPLPGRASGGPVSSGSAYVVGENGPELFIPSQSGTVVPNNDRAASPWASGGPAQVFVGIEASEYFDGRVLRTTGPVIAQAAIASTSGGAKMARTNLSREAQHRLE